MPSYRGRQKYSYIVRFHIGRPKVLLLFVTGCPPNTLVAKCLVNPCDVSTCTAYPSAICEANYCGGCNSNYYVKGIKVKCG